MPSSEKRTLRLEASREELSRNFRQLTKPADVAELLEIDYWMLLYFLFRILLSELLKNMLKNMAGLLNLDKTDGIKRKQLFMAE